MQGRRCRLPFRQAAIAALSAWLLISSQAAEAECIPTTTPTTGQTVDCSGASSTPVEAGPGQTDITVNIRDGATLTTGGPAISLFDGSSINLIGTGSIGTTG